MSKECCSILVIDYNGRKFYILIYFVSDVTLTLHTCTINTLHTWYLLVFDAICIQYFFDSDYNINNYENYMSNDDFIKVKVG